MPYFIPFVKAHGLGNDFVIADLRDLPAGSDLSKLALNISDRRLGIGCDQFLLYKEEEKFCEVIIYNSDGSRARACGNGTRCLAKLIASRKGLANLTLKVGDRNLDCFMEADGNVTVNMGKVSFSGTNDKILELSRLYSMDFKEIICADIGNPHLVIFGNLSEADKEILAKRLSEEDIFPDGVNVNFASLRDGKIFLSVWERGAGFTLACASGACATFASAQKLGFVGLEAEVVFKLGSLYISSRGGDIIMEGDANLVAEGKFYYER